MCYVLLKLHVNVHILKHKVYRTIGAPFPCASPVISPVSYSGSWAVSTGTKLPYAVGMYTLTFSSNYFSKRKLS